MSAGRLASRDPLYGYDPGMQERATGIVNSGHFKAMPDGTVVILGSTGGTYRVPAGIGMCTCTAFRTLRTCPHVLAAALVRVSPLIGAAAGGAAT